MVPVKDLQRVFGNPTLDSLNGEKRAPLQTILSETWTDQERAEFGVYLVDTTPPDGMKWIGEFEDTNGNVAAVFVPITDEERREAMPPVTRMQFAIALARFDVISAEEAKAFGPGNALPAVAVAAIQAAPLSDAEKLDAEIKALSADTIRRTNPLVAMMQAAKRLTDEQADQLFTTAAGID